MLNLLGQLTKMNKDMLLFLTRNDKNELEHFFEKYWDGPDRQIFSITKFRIHKLNEDPISYDVFESEYKKNKKLSLERLFKQLIVDSDIEELDALLKSGVTLQDLYDEHMQDRVLPFTRVIKNIESRSIGHVDRRFRTVKTVM